MKRAFCLIVFLSALLLLIFCLRFEEEKVPIDQPIDFSHRIHAGEKGMPYLYFHSSARKSTVAGIPPVKTCMGCHRTIGHNNPEVQKLRSYWQSASPIEWKRVYELEDFVYFSHKRHVMGKIDCSECHGEVDEMDRVLKVRDLTMGWCLDCHKKREAEIDCITCHK